MQIKRDIDQLTQQIESLVKANDACQRLLDIEGVGPISAVLLYATLGSGEAFHNGREFSAYLGLTCVYGLSRSGMMISPISSSLGSKKFGSSG